MGDSSVSCVLSNVSLYDERAVLLALAPAGYSEPSRKQPSFRHGARVVSNDGAAAYFAPFLLPIFGRMDGYGRLHEIERTPHVEWLEKRLQIPIERIAESVADGHSLDVVTRAARRYGRSERRVLATTGGWKHTVWDGKPYSCYFARDVWDQFSADTWDESGESVFAVWNGGRFSPRVLGGMGFVEGQKNEDLSKHALGNDGARYSTPWKHPEIPALTAWCDGYTSRFAFDDGVVMSNAYRPADLLRYPTSAPLPLSLVKWAQETPVVALELDKEREFLLQLRGVRRHVRKQELADSQTTFDLIEVRLPDGVQEPDYRAEVLARRDRMKKKEPLGPPSVAPVGTMQVFCCLKNGLHARLVAGPDGSCQGHVVNDCDCPKERPSHHDLLWHPNIPFSDAVYADLRARGWRLASKASEVLLTTPNRGCAAPEMRLLYGLKHLGRFKPEMVALVTVLQNMEATNRLLMPTSTGYQYGCHSTQLKLAQVVERFSRKHIRRKDDDE